MASSPLLAMALPKKEYQDAKVAAFDTYGNMAMSKCTLKNQEFQEMLQAFHCSKCNGPFKLLTQETLGKFVQAEFANMLNLVRAIMGMKYVVRRAYLPSFFPRVVSR